MTWWAWLLAGYGAIAVVALRPLAGHLAWTFYRHSLIAYPISNEGRKEPDGGEWFGAFLCAGFLLIAWPLVFVAWLGGRRLPKMGAERLAEIERRKQRLRKAERELGLIDR